MFEEFLRDEMFTAASLVTDWDKRLAVVTRFGQKIPNRILKEATDNDYDNLPVIHGGEVKGFIRLNELKDGFLEQSLLHPFESFKIPPKTRLPELVERLLKDGTEPSALYFVMGQDGEPKGIMTYADLNRRTAYIFSYTLVMFLEQWIRKRIVEKYYEHPRKLSANWMSALTPERRDYLQRVASQKGESTLSVCGLEDLIRVLRRDSALASSLRQVDRKVLINAEEIRPRVAHPTKLLVPRRNARNRLRHLAVFWQGMVPFVAANDFNEKNGGWPVEP